MHRESEARSEAGNWVTGIQWCGRETKLTLCLQNETNVQRQRQIQILVSKMYSEETCKICVFDC